MSLGLWKSKELSVLTLIGCSIFISSNWVDAERLKVDLSVSGQPGGTTEFTNRKNVNSAMNTHRAVFDGIVVQ